MTASSGQRAEIIKLVATDPLDDGVSDVAAFTLLEEGNRHGTTGALITVIDITGGAPRPVGTHMAVLADGRYCGYVSGGCIEPGIAREALRMIERGQNGIIRIGAGSPWIDLRLPCGGGLALQVMVAPSSRTVSKVVAGACGRHNFSVSLGPLLKIDDRTAPTGWHEGTFHRRYIPEARVVIVGEGREASTLARVATASGMSVRHLSVRISLAPFVDRRTAVVLLDHDHDREQPVLLQALETDAFFIGAMGSVRTHAMRSDELRQRGVNEKALARIHGPIGVIERTRNSRALAFSILAEIVSEAAQDEAAAR